MRVFGSLALLLCLASGAAAAAAVEQETVVRDYYASRANGDVPRALSLLASTVEPAMRSEVKDDLEWRCFELRGIHVRQVGETQVEAIAHVLRPPRGRGPVIEDVERRTFTLVREGDAWRIASYRLAEEALVDQIVAAKTPDEVAALLAANPKMVTPTLARRLVSRAVRIGRAALGRPDRRLAEIAYHVASMLGDRAQIVNALGTRANSLRLPGSPSEPVTALVEQALAVAQELGDPSVYAYAANNVAIMHMDFDGTSNLAETALRDALKERHNLASSSVSTLLQNLGAIQFHRGDYAAAYKTYMESLALAFDRGDEYGLAFREFHLGQLMAAQNDHELALEYYRRASKRKTIKQWVIRGHLGIAEASLALGRPDDAQAAAKEVLAQAIETPYSGYVAGAYVVLAEIQIARNEMQAAEEALRTAVEYARKDDKDQSAIVNAQVELGNLLFRTGRHEEARALANEVLAFTTGSSDFPMPQRYGALMLAARAERALGNHDKATAMYETAIDAIETARHYVAGSERQQRLFFEPFHAAYTELADLLLERGSVAEALAFAERGKGRVLLDAIARERKTAEAELPSSEREQLVRLVKSLGEANQRVLALRIAKETTPRQLDEAIARQRDAQHALARFEVDAAAHNPRLRGVRTGAMTASAAELRALVTRPDFAFLEYVVQDRVTHLLVVERHGVTHHRIDVTSAELAKRIDAFRTGLASRNLRYRPTSRALYDLLLAPAAAQLAGKRVLAIVPDNVLWRLPFEALIAPDRKFVVEHAACFYIPSITVYRDMLARQQKESDSTLVAAFGNPALEGTRDALRAIYRSVDLGPLPDAEEEVRAIAKTWGSRASVYMREAAREETARAEMQRARVVHFAAHGIFDDGNPMFSQIVLARDPRSQEDGVLQAWELMRLDLAADLVVLAACDTARGQYGAGEGLIGMTWALFAGGCPSTVVAQWKVSSQSSAKLMVEFHEMLAKNASSPFAKAEALRAAQLALLRNARTTHPFYWSAFVLIGSPSF